MLRFSFTINKQKKKDLHSCSRTRTHTHAHTETHSRTKNCAKSLICQAHVRKRKRMINGVYKTFVATFK